MKELGRTSHVCQRRRAAERNQQVEEYKHTHTHNIYQVETIACEVIFQCKSNLNVFKGIVIIDQEIVAAFISFITTVKRTQ